MDYFSVKPRFDDVLQSHFERLIGTRVGMRGLFITLETITALSLLAERVEDGEDDPSKFHTKATLRQEMAEVGLESKELIEESLQHLEEKGYYRVLESGGLQASEDVSTMSGALDKVFPQMPGMLLVAYYVQTLQEVISGRKGIDHAVDQFDQALAMHGMSARKDKPSETKKSLAASKEDMAKKRLASLRKLSEARAAASRQKEAESYSLANLGGTEETGEPAVEPQAIEPEPEEEVFVSSETITQHPPIDEPTQREQVAAAEEHDEVPGPREDNIEEEDVQEDIRQDGEGIHESALEQSIQEESSWEDGEDEEVTKEELEDGKVAESEAIAEPIEPEEEPFPARELQDAGEAESDISGEDPVQPESPEMADADIMERVAQFEEALAMTCPLCGEGKIKEQQTSMGKIFFCLHTQVLSVH